MMNDKNSLILLGIIAVLILGIAFGIGWLVVTGGQRDNNNPVTSNQSNELKEAKKHRTYTVAGEPIVSNLNTGIPGDRRAIRVKTQLKVKDSKMIKELENKNAEIIDIIISILRTKTPEEMIQTNAKEVVKKEIIEQLNNTLHTDKILDVFFEEFLVQ